MTGYQYETPYGVVEIEADSERRAKQKLFAWLKEMARITDAIRVSYGRWGVQRVNGDKGSKGSEVRH